MLDQKTFTIGEQQWVIQTLPSSRGMQVAIYIAHILAGAAEGFAFSERIQESEVNIAAMIAGPLKRLSVIDTPTFIKKLVMDSVIIPDVKTGDNFEIMFAANYDVLWELVERIIEHNKFGDVLKKKVTAITALLFSDAPKPGASTDSTSGR